MTQTYQLFIDDKWRDAANGSTMPAINPYNYEVHGTVLIASTEDVAEAVTAARRAFDQVWSKSTPGGRAKLLN